MQCFHGFLCISFAFSTEDVGKVNRDYGVRSKYLEQKRIESNQTIVTCSFTDSSQSHHLRDLAQIYP